MHAFGFEFLLRNFWVSLFLNKQVDYKPIQFPALFQNSMRLSSSTNNVRDNFLSPTEMFRVKQGRQLNFQHRQHLTGGNFKSLNCTVKPSSTMTPPLQVELFKPSKIRCGHSSGKETQKNGKDYLTCTANGNPLPNVTWLYNNQVTQGTFERRLNETAVESSLLFPLEFLARGGNYSFIASNKLGQDKQDFILDSFN